jgi:Extensin-like protein C-terminus
MRDGSGCIRRQPNAAFFLLLWVAVLFLSGWSTVIAAEIVPLPRERPSSIPEQRSVTASKPQVSPCQQRLAQIAGFKSLPAITGPGECMAEDVVMLDWVLLPDQNRIGLTPAATLRCPMAETVAHWLRDDVTPVIATLATSLRHVETLDSFVCRGRNGTSGGKVSEHGRANALDVRALKLTDGRTIALNDDKASKPLREKLRRAACARFTTVLGNGADAYHESHVHLDLLERSNNYRICQWAVLDEAETATLPAKKAETAADAAAGVASEIPLPRPRPVLNSAAWSPPRHPRERVQQATRGSLFNVVRPATKQKP